VTHNDYVGKIRSVENKEPSQNLHHPPAK